MPHIRRSLSGDKLAYHRDMALLTQEELGRRASLTKSTISRLEGGYHMARYSTINRLAKALRVNPEELLEPTENSQDNSQESDHKGRGWGESLGGILERTMERSTKKKSPVCLPVSSLKIL